MGWDGMRWDERHYDNDIVWSGVNSIKINEKKKGEGEGEANGTCMKRN